MKFQLLVLLTFLLSSLAHADLLERVHLEDALRERIEQNFRVHDPHVRVFTRFEYKTYQTELPGTNINAAQDFVPSKVESSDITKINVEIYTELTNVADDIKSSMYKLIPIDRSKVSISYRQVQPAATPKVDQQKPVEAKDLSEIAERSINSLGKIILAVLGAGVIILLATFVYQSSRKMKEFREQFNLLVKAIAEGGAGGGAPIQLPESLQQNRQAATPTNGDNSPLETLKPEALRELFADCYWCNEDGYAHWLWKHLDGQQRAELYQRLPFMKEYSLYFVNVNPVELGHHDHPYYLQPLDLSEVSEEDLRNEVEGNLSFWHQIGPMRQEHLTLNLEKKLQAVQSPVQDNVRKISKHSTKRTLEAPLKWGDLSQQDELTLFTNPNLVPPALRGHIHSLVWLAQKDAETIKRVLAKYDARSLATAWVGPEDVLKKLEENLPEKKLKLLQTYKDKTQASRHSQIYQALVAEGLKHEDEAA